jgi:uncharacterized protein with HEPN domain
MKNRDYRDYAQDILDSINDIKSFTKGMNFSQFTKDRKTINAVIRSVEVTGEAAKKIPKALRDKYPDIPWKKMAGMRDKMIHEYFGIDVEILWKVAKKDLPSLKPIIEKMLNSLLEDMVYQKIICKGDK